MKTYALLCEASKTVLEVINWQFDGTNGYPTHNINQTFSTVLAPRIKLCPSNVEAGYTYTAPNTWTAPVVDNTPAPEAPPDIPDIPLSDYLTGPLKAPTELDFARDAILTGFPFIQRKLTFDEFLSLFTTHEINNIVTYQRERTLILHRGHPDSFPRMFATFAFDLVQETFEMSADKKLHIWHPVILNLVFMAEGLFRGDDSTIPQDIYNKLPHEKLAWRRAMFLSGRTPTEYFFMGTATTIPNNPIHLPINALMTFVNTSLPAFAPESITLARTALMAMPMTMDLPEVEMDLPVEQEPVADLKAEPMEPENMPVEPVADEKAKKA